MKYGRISLLMLQVFLPILAHRAVVKIKGSIPMYVTLSSLEEEWDMNVSNRLQNKWSAPCVPKRNLWQFHSGLFMVGLQ